MKRIKYFSSHKKKRKFQFELFGFLYSFLYIGMITYYFLQDGGIEQLKDNLFLLENASYNKVFFFSLIFLGLLNLIYFIGLIKMFRHKLNIFLYIFLLSSPVSMSICAYFFESHFSEKLFLLSLLLYNLGYLFLLLGFFLEKHNFSVYGNRAIRYFDIIIIFIFTLCVAALIFNNKISFITHNKGYLQLVALGLNALFILINSFYMLVKNVSRHDVK